MILKFSKFIALLLIVGLVLLNSGCRTIFLKNPEKKAQKAQEKEEKQFQKNYAKIKKAHLKNQDKATRKRMKKKLRQAKKTNKKKKSDWDCR